MKQSSLSVALFAFAVAACSSTAPSGTPAQLFGNHAPVAQEAPAAAPAPAPGPAAAGAASRPSCRGTYNASAARSSSTCRGQVAKGDPTGPDAVISGAENLVGDHDGATVSAASLPGGTAISDEILTVYADLMVSNQRKRLGAHSITITETQRSISGHHAMELDLRATGYDGAPVRVQEVLVSVNRRLVAVALDHPAPRRPPPTTCGSACATASTSMPTPDASDDRSPPPDVFGSYRY